MRGMRNEVPDQADPMKPAPPVTDDLLSVSFAAWVAFKCAAWVRRYRQTGSTRVRQPRQLACPCPTGWASAGTARASRSRDRPSRPPSVPARNNSTSCTRRCRVVQVRNRAQSRRGRRAAGRFPPSVLRRPICRRSASRAGCPRRHRRFGPQDADQLGLRVGRNLEVQAAQRAFAFRIRVIVLHEAAGHAERAKPRFGGRFR